MHGSPMLDSLLAVVIYFWRDVRLHVLGRN